MPRHVAERASACNRRADFPRRLARREASSLWSHRAMAGTRRTGPRPDVDGVRIEKLSGVRGGVWLMIAALVAVGIALLVLSRPRVAPPGERSADARPAAAPGGGTSRS